MVPPSPPWTGMTGPAAAGADAGVASPQQAIVTSSCRSIGLSLSSGSPPPDTPPRPTGFQSGRGESNPHLWLGKPTSWPLDNARAQGQLIRRGYACRVRMRVFWPVTLAAAALVGLLAYGVAAKHTSTTLDDALAKGRRPAAPEKALPRLGV